MVPSLSLVEGPVYGWLFGVSPNTIAELQELNFMQEHRPLVIEGKPVVGKSWLGMAIAKRACDECHRVRWTIFSELLAELGSLRILDADYSLAKAPVLTG